ncbi:hypothetical protein BKA64DRAFT_303025 [Cadophora sp. MPI-SDFR-AT-0126]|nr:hypothetical protein BKA64DRAFT_303025 [Leotiomycetes sp. MPI-SDFR-AT-0126]
MSTVTADRYSSSFMPELDPEDEPRSSIESPASSIPTKPSRRAAIRKSSYVPREHNLPQLASEAPAQEVAGPSAKASEVNASLKKPNLPADPVSNPSTNNRKRPTGTRPTDAEPPRPSPIRTRQRSRGDCRELHHFAVPAPAAPGPPKIPKLSQDRRPLGVYYRASTVTLASLGLDGGQPEFDFISSFINGISSKKEKNQLLDSLANFCFCDTKDDGTREILCTWDEVLDGLKAAELVSDENGSQDKGKGKAALNSDAVPNAVDARITNNPRTAEVSSFAEQPISAGSRRGAIYNATDQPYDGRERRELKTADGRSGHSGNDSRDTGSRAVGRAEPGSTKSGAPIEKPGPSKVNVSEKSGGAKGKANTRVAKRQALKNGKVVHAANTPDLGGSNSGSAINNGAAAEGVTRGGRTGRPRAAKR